MSALTLGALLAIAAGVLSNLWTVLLKLSGLNGYYMPLGYAAGSIAVAIPLATWAYYVEGVSLAGVRWGVLAGAAAMSGCMLLLIVAMLAITPQNLIGIPLMIWALSQVSMAAAYTVYVNGADTRTILGYVASMVTVYLLVGPR